MANFSEHETAFINAMTFHIERDWKGRKSVFADNAGISGGYVSQIIGRKKCPQLDKQEKIAKALGYKTIYEFVDFGKTLTSADLMGVIPKFQIEEKKAVAPPSQVISFQDESDKKHAAVIAGFEDKEKAVEINQMLVEIEKLEGTTGLEAIRKYVAFQLNEAREKKGLLPLQMQKNGTNQQK